MGVKNLWTVLSSACEEGIEITSLHGQTVAVDLSSWICELKKIPLGQQIPNLYIKNIYHRTIYLMKHGIKLVFVEDGTAPEIKKAALLQRSNGMVKNMDRIGLKSLSKQCRELFTHLGVPCIESGGEAEALCAKLNSEGVVDGVITSDGDTLLYGARKVYRNLQINTGTVDLYDMDTISNQLKLSRTDLVTMAILCGCDYQQEGVYSIGGQKAYEFIQHCHKHNLDSLLRIKNWRSNKELKNLQTIKESPDKKKSHCTVCKHPGTKPEHFRNGCRPCDREQSCDPNSSVKCKCNWCCVELNKFELSMREKALKDEGFPDQKVIEEFWNFGSNKISPELQWRLIDVIKLKRFIQCHWSWTDLEFFNKISEFMVLLQVNGMEWAVANKLQPLKVVRRSVQKRIPSVIVEWKKLDIDTETKKSLAVSVPEKMFTTLYPDMIKDFDREKAAEKQQKFAERKRKAKDQSEIKKMKGQKTITDCFSITKKAKRSPSPKLFDSPSDVDGGTECIVLD